MSRKGLFASFLNMELDGLSWELLQRNTIQKCRNLSELKSSKAIFVCQQAPVSCQIWFPCKSSLIWTRCEDVGSNLSRLIKLPSRINTCTLFPQHSEEDEDKGAESLGSLDIDKTVAHDQDSAPSMMNEVNTDGSPSNSPTESQDSPCSILPSKSLDSPSSSSSFLLEDDSGELVEIDDKLDCDKLDGENPKQCGPEETLEEYRANEDVSELMHKDEASECSYVAELGQKRKKELSDLLIQQRQELEKMQDKQNEILSEHQLVENQTFFLERQLQENYDAEKELEEKIIQAVDLMISFKEKRDMLRIERDNALEEAQRYRKLIKEDAAAIPTSFSFSFLDIMEATEHLDPSMKIGEGEFGSVYKGIIRQTKVAIRMLFSGGYQSDAAFEHEVEVLSRVRHPNLVTLVGACTESRSLIYEFLENGSLEDHLAGRSKKHPLPWQLRLKIASEICSVLLFLHSKRCFIVHGNLKPSNILLDGNFVSKISNLGMTGFQNKDGRDLSRKNNLEASLYRDPRVARGRYTRESDVYSFGIVLLRLLTARPVSSLVRDVWCAMEAGSVETILDYSAGDWPLEPVKRLISLGLKCCQEDRVNRADLGTEVWPVLKPYSHLNAYLCLDSTSSHMESKGRGRIPSHFVCPIFQVILVNCNQLLESACFIRPLYFISRGLGIFQVSSPAETFLVVVEVLLFCYGKLQEVMKDPYIAADGFTYELDAIKGWLNSGHDTSPMTNLKLDNCELIPNYALYYAIQEWEQEP
ncbi:OLC1v1027447C4 [Oldenlandia corymbosa var. corymbosa]|uniref:RING-type E3 ubiquitin transferase n=1 Tax=Oldenlandia corymbosa var. corymbosa TaxID=529605 RepID=A0AAV1CCP9_OLDCO|nr:OLC1v1027447C4 [Oldenlandia corymbosa var. corymbosa]